jgi:hypothetical protein
MSPVDLVSHRSRPGRRLSAALLAVSLVCLLTAARGAEAAAAIDARYRVTIAGLPAGTMSFKAEPGDQEGILSRFLFRSQGVLSLFGDIESQIRSQSRREASTMVPASFRGDYRRNERRREVAIDYGRNGAAERVAVRQRGVLRPGRLPGDLLAGTVDPVTAFFVARDRLARLDAEAILVPVFDGRRRYDLMVRRTGTTEVRLGGGGSGIPAEILEVRFHGRAEVDDETGEVRPEEPDHRDRRFRLTVTADGRRLPLTLESDGTRFPFRAELVADCATQVVACAAGADGQPAPAP